MALAGATSATATNCFVGPQFSFKRVPNPVGRYLAAVPARKTTTSTPFKVLCSASNADSSAPSPASSSRRHALLQLGAAGLAVGAWDSLSLPLPAEAANIRDRQQRGYFFGIVNKTLLGYLDANRDIIPGILSLTIRDAGAYDPVTKTGGANGTIHLEEELNRPENSDLKPVVAKLAEVKAIIDDQTKGIGGPIGWADLIYVAGEAALKKTFLFSSVKKSGGDYEKGKQLYLITSSPFGLFDQRLGRADGTEPSPPSGYPGNDAPPAEIKAYFAKLGLKPRQVAVLSAFFGPDVAATEARFATDPDLAPWVKNYQASKREISETNYQVDVIDAFTKLSLVNQKYNDVAYTYYVPPPTFRL